MKYKKVFYGGNSPWAKTFLSNISPHFLAYEFSRGISYANCIKNINIENETVVGDFLKENTEIENPQIKFPTLREKDIIEDSFYKNPYLLKNLKEPSVQNGLSKGFADVVNNIIPDWNDLYISCSCGTFDYLKPCKHIVGLFLYLVNCIDKKPEILFSLQGINIEYILKSSEKLIFFEDFIEKYNDNENIINEENNYINEEENNKANIDEINNKNVTEIKSIVKTRIGQIQFRNNLISVHQRCQLCNINIEKLLFASHIKKWANSNDKERLDINNGLLLCPMHDKLFDLGFITFNEYGNIKISSEISSALYVDLKISNELNIKINNEMKKYLIWHNENVFKK